MWSKHAAKISKNINDCRINIKWVHINPPIEMQWLRKLLDTIAGGPIEWEIIKKKQPSSANKTQQIHMSNGGQLTQG